jgi:hypothetical protein
VRTANYAEMYSGMGGVDASTWSAPNAAVPASRSFVQHMNACGFHGIKLTHKANVRPEGLLGGSTG